MDKNDQMIMVVPVEKLFNSGNDSFEGFKCSVVTYKYESALDDKGFCGGFNRFSLWMNREDIITAFLRYGMTRYSINFDEKEHVNGPAFCVYFQK